MLQPHQSLIPDQPVSGRQRLAALAWVLVLTLLLFSSTWGQTLFFRDLLRWTYPGIFFYRQSLLAGELPLWNPYLFMGYPFLAELANAAVLYPLSLLHLLFSIPTAMKVYPAAHYLLAGYLMWRLLREWGLAQEAALFGALAWMASGYLISLHLTFNYLNLAWYPGLLFCFQRLLVTRRLRWLLLTGLCWAMFFLAGDPQGLLFGGVLMLLYGTLAFRSTTPVRNTAALLLFAAGLTSLVILAQFLPSLEFGAWCTKLEGYPWEDATFWSHHPLRLLEWVWPGLWGNLFPPDRFWGLFLRPYTLTLWAGAIYLGLFPLALALTQGRRWREKPVGFLLVVLILFYLLALGSYSPLFRLLWDAFPPYRIFRYPEKHLAVVTFALAGLAGLGFQHLLGPEQQAARRSFLRGWTALTAALVAVLVAALIAGGPASRHLADYLRQAYQYSVAPRLISASWLHAGARAVAVALVFLILLWRWRRAPARGRVWAWALLLATAADLLSLGRTYFMVADPSLYTSPPAAARRIREQEAGAAEPFRIYQASTAFYSRFSDEPQAPKDWVKWMTWNRDTLLSNLGAPEGLQEIFGYDPAEMVRLQRFKSRPLRPAVLQMLNVKYLIQATTTCKFPLESELSAICSDADSDWQLERNEGYFPRAFFVDGIVSAKNEAEFLNLLDTADLQRSVILRDPPSGPRAGTGLLPARITRYQNRRVEVEIANSRPGHVVLSDTYFPGWQAAVDGIPARILRANYLVRAVALEPGHHRVVFTYRPWPWRIGGAASLISLLVLPFTLLVRGRSQG